MKRLRKSIALFAALIFFVQGVAAAAAIFEPPAPVSVSAEMQPGPPDCHGSGGTTPDEQHACCSFDCPTMLTCTLGHAAAQAVTAAIAPPVFSHAPPMPPEVLAGTPPPAPLRPPIAILL
ncbi:MAG: hypothetical protein AB7Q97_22750 [Gammaproteobacteria bacterium]